MWPFNSSRINDPADDDMIGVNILVCGFCLFGSLILGSISGLNYLEFHNLEVNGESTNAVIVKRTYVAENRRIPHFFVRYEFENVYAEKDCPVRFSTSITPKEQACRRSVQEQEVSEETYYSLAIGDSLPIRYLRSAEKTRSMITNGLVSKSSYLIRTLFFLLIALISGRIFLRAMRTLSNAPHQFYEDE